MPAMPTVAAGFLRRVAEDELNAEESHRRDEIMRPLDLATAPMGGEGAKLIREDRDSR
jgi:hypothetical protein